MNREKQRIFFEKIDSVNNPRSIHGLYPYRGKISAIDAANIIRQLPKQGTLLDPFSGSGTIVYEAQKHGLKAIGVDNNPLAFELSKAKVFTTNDSIIQETLEACNNIIERASLMLASGSYPDMPESPKKSFHEATASEIMCVSEFLQEMNDYLKGAYYGAIALTARGCNDYKWTSSTVGKNIEPKRYINFFEKFLDKTKKHLQYCNSINHEEASIYLGDSRRISEIIPEKSIDFVFTSPPYFDALDYTAYYGKLIYEIHNVDRVDIKKNLIQNITSYENDMRLVLDELDKITKDDALIIFVVGDKKGKNGIINGGEFFDSIKKSSYIIERSYKGTSSQVFDTLNKTARKEQIVVWDKKEGSISTI